MLKLVEFGLLAVSLLIVAALILAAPAQPPADASEGEAQPELHS
ncbi:hypothetical protein [Silvibacterium dinghuense]|nr:hypothetical protein [Silvibacterium dinghuense]GGH03860.1 hypothetical protein GCM10011586_19810 [Silvibacterium dinghuense]